MKEKKANSGGSLCGGVISQSMNRKAMEKDVWATAMCFVLPDDKYTKYVALKEQGKNKEATKIFNKFAQSQI